MKPSYVRELKPFFKSDILEFLGNDENAFNKLRMNNIINKNDDGCYNFHYVGVIVVDKNIINVYPKYIPNQENIKEDFKEILKVLTKYQKLHEDFDNQYDDFDDNYLYILSLMIFFIEDYYENGVYYTVKDILETNGSGEINWDKTINYTFPLIKSNKPFYTELQTNYRINDLFNYFKLLHEFILTRCSRCLEHFELLDILDLTSVELSDKILDDFGDLDFILNKLQMELNVEYNTHKQKLLKSMYDYLSCMNSFSNEKILAVYGTTDYEHVWEEMCSIVFDNQLDTSFVDLNLGIDRDDKLCDFIKKPKWILDGKPYFKRTLKPDLITIVDNQFIILDAKYYNFFIENNQLKNQPDLESITKQYLYELAYKEIINSKELKVINAFLFPTYYAKDAKKRGFVELDIWGDFKLKKIDVLMIHAKKVNECYLENKLMSIEFSD